MRREKKSAVVADTQSYISPNETLMFPLKPPFFLLPVSQTIALCQQFVPAKMYGVINI